MESWHEDACVKEVTETYVAMLRDRCAIVAQRARRSGAVLSGKLMLVITRPPTGRTPLYKPNPA